MGRRDGDGVVSVFCLCLREVGLGTCRAGFKCRASQPWWESFATRGIWLGVRFNLLH